MTDLDKAHDLEAFLRGLDDNEGADIILSLIDDVEQLKAALVDIDAKVSWELNPSNYEHQEVCDLNSDWCEVGDIATAALNPPAPEET